MSFAKLSFLLLVATLFLMSCNQTSLNKNNKDITIENQLIIGFEKDVSSEQAKTLLSQANLEILQYIEGSNAYVVSTNKEQSPNNIIEKYSEHQWIRYIETNNKSNLRTKK